MVTGTVDVGDGQRIAWYEWGDPAGTPLVVLHGGPGSGARPGALEAPGYRVIGFDQRGCGRSTPDAGLVTTDLSVNTTAHLVADVEALREHVGVDRWVVLGGSWGTTLGLAYAQAHPASVRALVLAAVVGTSAREVEWLTRDVGRLLPQEWERFRDGVPPPERDGNLAAAYARLLADPDPAVRERAARDWCDWEDRHVAIAVPHVPHPRYDDPRFRLTFARLVTHYFGNAGFLRPGRLLEDAPRLHGIPGVLVHGRRDITSPLEFPVALARRWPDARLEIVDDAGHGGGGMGAVIAAALEEFRSAV